MTQLNTLSRVQNNSWRRLIPHREFKTTSNAVEFLSWRKFFNCTPTVLKVSRENLPTYFWQFLDDSRHWKITFFCVMIVEVDRVKLFDIGLWSEYGSNIVVVITLTSSLNLTSWVKYLICSLKLKLSRSTNWLKLT